MSLLPGAVDGFVLWTRNLRPLLSDLDAVRRVAPFTVQFTVTGHERALETSVITAEFDAAAHTAGFAALARALKGTVDEVVLSVMHPYRKTRRNLDRAAANFRSHDPEAPNAPGVSDQR